uniref:Uncharacterized protein n=1 Tax=Anopheles dirus TaxID=7168 RepID=A0A182NSI0_9DIPT
MSVCVNDVFLFQHVIHKVNYVVPAATTTLKLESISVGSPIQLHPVGSTVAKYNYAVPQVTYAHYPQYQVYHHHQAGPGGVQPTATAIYAAHQLHEHPVATATVHEIPHQHQQQQQQQQQHTAYAHQQPIYAHHPSAAIHYTVPASLVHAGQHNYQQQQQQQQQLPLSHTQAIHYQPQGPAGGQPAVPIVHQAPIATINQVHQAQQVYATQGQLTKYPLAAQSYYGAGGLPNQIYSTAPSYGDPDTLTNLANPTTPRFPTTSRRPSSRPVPGDIRPITEYEDDDDTGDDNDVNGEDGVQYRDEPAPASGTDRNSGRDEPCAKGPKKPGQPNGFNRNLYNMWRAYEVARTLLKASGASGTPSKPSTATTSTNDNTDRIQLIHPPGESDKKLKGKYYEGKYYGYYRHGRQDTGQDRGQMHAAASNGLAGKQLLSTVAAPVHLKSLVPVTTATSTQHHGNGISYTAFTQPSQAASIPLTAHLKPVPQSLLQAQPAYYNTPAASNVQQQQQQLLQQQPNLYYRTQLHQQQQQQQQQQAQHQQRLQIYPTAASPLQKAPLPYPHAQFNHPVPSQYAAYGYGPQQTPASGGLFQPQASVAKITYAQTGGVGGGRGSIYLLH